MTIVTADGFSYESSIFPRQASDPVWVDSGQITLDAMGSAVAGQMTWQDGTVRRFRLVQAVYR